MIAWREECARRLGVRVNQQVWTTVARQHNTKHGFLRMIRLHGNALRSTASHG